MDGWQLAFLILLGVILGPALVYLAILVCIGGPIAIVMTVVYKVLEVFGVGQSTEEE